MPSDMPYDMRKMLQNAQICEAYATAKNPNFCTYYAAAENGPP